MSREVPLALQTSASRSLCLRLHLRDGTVLGFTDHDKPVAYDHLDGFGEVAFAASQGMDASDFESDAGYGVSNAEARVLVRSELPALTAQMVRAGGLDDAQWVCFLVDWRAPSPGSGMVLDAGDVGEVRLEQRMVVIPELLSYMMRLRQAVGHTAQRPCRAIFGSPATGMRGCGVDAEGLWADGEVQSVGAESDRTFTGDIPAHFPGRVEFTTGPNAGRQYVVESVDGNTITLAETTPYPIEDDHQYRHREHCTMQAEGAGGCKARGNYLNYKGEDKIPVEDGMAGSIPGGQMPGGGGWTGEQPVAEQ